MNVTLEDLVMIIGHKEVALVLAQKQLQDALAQIEALKAELAARNP